MKLPSVTNAPTERSFLFFGNVGEIFVHDVPSYLYNPPSDVVSRFDAETYKIPFSQYIRCGVVGLPSSFSKFTPSVLLYTPLPHIPT